MSTETNANTEATLPAQPELLNEIDLENCSGGSVFRVNKDDPVTVISRDPDWLDKYIRRHTA